MDQPEEEKYVYVSPTKTIGEHILNLAKSGVIKRKL